MIISIGNFFCFRFLYFLIFNIFKLHDLLEVFMPTFQMRFDISICALIVFLVVILILALLKTSEGCKNMICFEDALSLTDKLFFNLYLTDWSDVDINYFFRIQLDNLLLTSTSALLQLFQYFLS